MWQTMNHNLHVYYKYTENYMQLIINLKYNTK